MNANSIIKRLYSIRDLKACILTPPVCLENDAVAVRSFGDLVSQNDTIYSKHPADFAMVFVGEMDFYTGALKSPEGGVVLLATGSDFVTK